MYSGDEILIEDHTDEVGQYVDLSKPVVRITAVIVDSAASEVEHDRKRKGQTEDDGSTFMRQQNGCIEFYNRHGSVRVAGCRPSDCSGES